MCLAVYLREDGGPPLTENPIIFNGEEYTFQMVRDNRESVDGVVINRLGHEWAYFPPYVVRFVRHIETEI